MTRKTEKNIAGSERAHDWRIYAEFAQALIRIARRLYAEAPLAAELEKTVYAHGSTTIDLCLSLFSWALFCSKWIKQHLRIKRFFGHSENAVKCQIWIAIASYVLIAIIKKQLKLDMSLYSLL